MDYQYFGVLSVSAPYVCVCMTRYSQAIYTLGEGCHGGRCQLERAQGLLLVKPKV